MKTLLSLILACISIQAAVPPGGIRINFDTSGTNTISSQVTITSNTNLNAGKLTATNLTTSRVLVSDTARGIISALPTTTEINYVAGVTGAIQPQIDSKAGSTSGTSILKGDGAGGFSSAVSSTDYAPATAGSAILKGNGLGGFAAASDGTDYLSPSTGVTSGRTISTTAPLTGGGDLSANRTLALTTGVGVTNSSGSLIANLAAGSNVTLTTGANGQITVASAGSVTASGGALTANAIVLGAGGTDTKVSASITTDGSAKITSGTLDLGNTTDTTLSRSASGVLAVEGVDQVNVNRTLTAGAGMSGGGTLAADRTFTWAPETQVNSISLFDGSQATRTITFGVTGTDPVATVSASSFDVSTGTLKQGGTAVALQSRALTVAGTANEITSSAGSQDLSADRTWTLSLPSAITLTGKTLTGGTFASPSLTTPTLGVAAATSINKWTFTAPTTAATLTAGADNLTYTGPSSSQTLVGKTSTDTLTNKRVTSRITTITSSATPTINTDNTDAVTITAQAAALTSMTTNLSGTPDNFDQLMFRIKDDGTARAITWGASFAARGAALPTTTVISKVLYVLFIYNTVTSTWDCVSTAQET